MIIRIIISSGHCKDWVFLYGLNTLHVPKIKGFPKDYSVFKKGINSICYHKGLNTEKLQLAARCLYWYLKLN